MKRRIVSLLLSATMLCPLLTGFTVEARAAEVKAFSDVPDTHWAYSAIMDMVEQGLFTGTSEVVDGVGTFSPNQTMTRAEFVTVLMRHLRPEELSAMPIVPGEDWWRNAYNLALHYSVVRANEFDLGKMDLPISRYETCVVLVRAAGMRRELAPSLVPESAIADFEKIGEGEYQHIQYDQQKCVRRAYALGLVGGIDSAGTFAPQAFLTRAEGAMMIYRLVSPEHRLQPELLDAEALIDHTIDDYPALVAVWDYNKKNGNKYEEYVYDTKYVAFDVSGTAYDPRTGYKYYWGYKGEPRVTPTENQTFVEGEPHSPPQVGDTVIKADGTSVVLKLGYGLVLGAGQNVDIYTNTQIEKADGTMMTATSPWWSFGKFAKDLYSDEVHARDEWAAIADVLYPPQDGTYKGEVCNTYFRWEGSGWCWIGPDYK